MNHTRTKLILAAVILLQYSSLQSQWPAIYYGVEQGTWNRVQAIATDDFGNCYVTGWIEFGVGTGDLRIATVKYGPMGGSPLWATIHSRLDPGSDRGISIAVDPSGTYVYVTGSIRTSPSYSTVSDYITIKYKSEDGVEEGVSMYNGTGDDDDDAQRIAIDRYGNIYVTGQSIGNGTNWDYVTIKYNSALVQQWVARFNNPSVNGDDIAYSLTTDLAGDVYVTGQSSNGSNADILTIKYSTSGVQQWVKRYDGGADDYANDIAVQKYVNLYVTGGSVRDGEYKMTTIKYDPFSTDNAPLWVNRDHSGVGQSITIFKRTCGQGDDYCWIPDIFVTGWGGIYNPATCAREYWGQLIRYDQNGVQEGFGTNNEPFASLFRQVKVDNFENVFVIGSQYVYCPEEEEDPERTRTSMLTAKYDKYCNLISPEYLPQNQDNVGRGISVNYRGDVYVTGITGVGIVTGGGWFNYMTMRYPSSNPIGCPWLYVFNDNAGEYTADNNLLHRSEFEWNSGVDVLDVYRLNNAPEPVDNKLLFKIHETENDHNSFDQVKLYAIDHPSGTRMGVTESNQIVMYNPIYISCGDSVLQDAGTQNIAPYVRYDYQGNQVIVGNDGGKIVAKDFPPFSGFLGDSIAVIMRVGENPNSTATTNAKTVAGTVNVYANSSPTAITRTIARREKPSNIIAPFAASTTSTDSVVVDWTRSYEINYLAIAQVSYVGFVPVNIPLIQATHSSDGEVLDKLLMADSNYTELDSTGVIYLTFFNIPPPLPNMIRDYVFETKGRYISGSGNDLFNRLIGQNNNSTGIPKQFKLYQNYPNPFNPVTTIKFELPRDSRASIKIYDVTGELIVTLLDEFLSAGSHKISFNGSSLASGIYFYRLKAGSFVEGKKMLLVK